MSGYVVKHIERVYCGMTECAHCTKTTDVFLPIAAAGPVTFDTAGKAGAVAADGPPGSYVERVSDEASPRKRKLKPAPQYP